MTLLLLICLVLSGLISGERCFSANFKDGLYPFLLTLPESRGSIWLAYTGGRLIGAVTALPFVLPARPVLLLRGLSSPEALFEKSILIAALALYLVYYFAGAALALAVRKEVLVYLLGFPVVSVLLGLLAASTANPFQQIILLERTEFLHDFSLGSLALALVEAALARRTFCRGEPFLLRRNIQALAEGGIAVTAFAALTWLVSGSSSLAALRDEWQPVSGTEPDSVYSAGTYPVSTDGRYLFIYQQLRERSLFKRLAVVDLKTGSMTDWMEEPGIRKASWSRSGAVLNVLTSSAWHRLSPDLKVLSARKIPGNVKLIHPFGNGLLLVSQQTSLSKQSTTYEVYRLSDQDGSLRKALTMPSEGYFSFEHVEVWSLPHGAVVVLRESSGWRAWWLDQEGRSLHTVSKPGPESDYYLLGSRLLLPREALEILRRGLSRPPGQGEPILPNDKGPLHLGSSRFFFLRAAWRSVDIWRHSSPGNWTRIFSNLPVTYVSFLNRDPGEWSSVKFATAAFDDQTWAWAAAVKSGGHDRLVLYDDQLGRSIPNTVGCGPEEEGKAQVQRTQGASGLLIRFTCSNRVGGQRHWFLNLVPGSGHVRYLHAHSAAVPADRFGRWIYLDPDGISVWVSSIGEIWQAGPGQRSRRLNPPETS